MIPLQRIERVLKRARHRWNLRQLLWTEIVDVLVERLAWVDFVFHTVEPCHEHGCEREIRIAARVWRTELHALGLRRCRIHRNATGCRAIAARVRKIDWRLETRNQALVRIRRWSNDR